MYRGISKYLKMIVGIGLAFIICLGVYEANAFAEERTQSIDEITVDLDVPLVNSTGADVDEINSCTVSTTNCTVESVVWYDEYESEVEDDETFFSGDLYKAKICIKAKDGYYFSPTIALLFKADGNIQDEITFELNITDGGTEYNEICIEYITKPIVIGEIDNISFTGLPTVEIGKKPVNCSIEKEKFIVKSEWYVYDKNVRDFVSMNADDLFNDDSIYKQNIIIYENLGYKYNTREHIYVMIDGEMKDNIMGGPNYIIIEEVYSDCKIIDRIHISEDMLPKAIEGETFSDSIIKLDLPDDYNYTAEGYWREMNSNAETGTFTKGKRYSFDITCYPKEGYIFDESMLMNIAGEQYNAGSKQIYTTAQYRVSLATKITEIDIKHPIAELGKTIQLGDFDIEVADDAPYTAYGRWRDGVTGDMIDKATVNKDLIYELDIFVIPKDGYEFIDGVKVNLNGTITSEYSNGSEVYIDIYYNFSEPIEKVEILNVQKPVIGNKIDTSMLKPAEPDKYYIESAVWYDVDLEEMVLPTKFEKGYEYVLSVEVKAKEGYVFNEYTETVLGDEKEVYADTITKNIYLSDSYSFKDIIPEVYLYDLPEFEVGKNTETVIRIPDNALYEAKCKWYVWDEIFSEKVEFDGIFEKGKIYFLSVDIKPKSGYSVEKKETEFYIDDKESNKVKNYMYGATYEVRFSEGLKEIDKLEFTIEKYKEGQDGSISPVIKVPQGANYYIDDDSDWIVGDNSSWRTHVGDFVADFNYGAYFQVVLDNGYVLSDNVQVIINGKCYNSCISGSEGTKFTIDFFLDQECEHIYDDDKDTSCNVCGDIRVIKSEESNDIKPGDTGNVKPGDMAATNILIILMVVCAGMVAFTRSYKKV